MEPNFRVGQYILEKPLGEGGMAEVWLARNAHIGNLAAVKFLNRAYAGASEIEQRFLNEGRRQGALNHPNIIKVYGFEYVGGHSFLILQYVDGESLATLLERTAPLEPFEASRIAISVLNALDYAHEENIVHRDIKPSNILLDRHGFPYLGDFGIVLAVNEKRITRTGTSMGTAHYMSPEQITKPGTVDRRSDIYSFGCVLCEMLTGEPPFNPGGDGDTDFAVKTAHLQQAPPSLCQRNPSLSPEIEAVVLRCLAKNPDERFATCRQMRDALSAAMVARPKRRETVIEPPAIAPEPYERVQPEPAPTDLAKKISRARNRGYLALRLAIASVLIWFILPRISQHSWNRDQRILAILAILATLSVASILGILAIAVGRSSKRLLQDQSSDAGLKSKAARAVALGWIALGIFAFWCIIFSATYKSL